MEASVTVPNENFTDKKKYFIMWWINCLHCSIDFLGKMPKPDVDFFGGRLRQ